MNQDNAVEIDTSKLVYPPNIRTPSKKRKLSNKLITNTYVKCGFRVVDTCKVLKINVSTWYDWVERYPDLRHEITMAKESLKDDIEKTLIEKAKTGDTQLLLYLAKTILKDRGYGAEKGDAQNTNNTQVNIVLPEDTSKKYEWWGSGSKPEVNNE
jgi:hypothetical protein